MKQAATTVNREHSRGVSVRAIWAALRDRMDRPAPVARLRLQHLALDPAQVQALEAVCTGLSDRLGVPVELSAVAGDIVVVNGELAGRVAPQALHAFCEERPLIAFEAETAAESGLCAAPGEALCESRQRELLRQLREIPLVRRLSSHWGANGWDAAITTFAGTSTLACDSVPGAPDLAGGAGWTDHAPALGEAEQAVVSWLLRGLQDAAVPPMVAGYGPGAMLRADFAARKVQIDPLALQDLCVRHALPLLAPSASPNPLASVRALDEIVWEFGIACGGYRLLDQPDGWCNRTLTSVPQASVLRYTRMPRQLELARRLFAGPTTAADLGKQVRVSPADLRPMIQACLFLGQIHWTR